MMSRVFSAAMFLTAVLLMMASGSLADSDHEWRCLPAQYTSLQQNQVTRHWYKVHTDFTNNRKLVQAVDSDFYLYFDLASNITYQNIGGKCTYYPSLWNSLIVQCAPKNTTLDVNAGVVEGEHMSVYSWVVAFELSAGEVTVTQDKFYPLTSSLTDRATGKSLYLTYSNVKEGVDSSVFDDVDLSDCSPSS